MTAPRCGRVDPAGLDAIEHGAGLQPVASRSAALVDGHQVARPNELVQLSVLDLACLASLWRVQHDEEMIVVGMHFRDVSRLAAVADREGVKCERVGQQPLAGRSNVGSQPRRSRPGASSARRSSPIWRSSTPSAVSQQTRDRSALVTTTALIGSPSEPPMISAKRPGAGPGRQPARPASTPSRHRATRPGPRALDLSPRLNLFPVSTSARASATTVVQSACQVLK